MDELQDVYDENGARTGQKKTKKQIFQQDLWRLVVHVWVVDDKGNLVIHQRAKRKIFDNLWDISVGGGVSAGEESRKAAVRETKEEIGLDLDEDELVYVGRYKLSRFIPEQNATMNDHSDTYVAFKNVEVGDLVAQESEVAQIKKISLDEFIERIMSDDYENWVPQGREYHQAVVKKIREIMNNG